MGHRSFDSYRAERTSQPGFDQAAYDAGRKQAGRHLAFTTAEGELTDFLNGLAETYELTTLEMVKLLADAHHGRVDELLRQEQAD